MKELLKYEELLTALNEVIDDKSLSSNVRCMMQDLRLTIKDRINPHWQDDIS